MSHRESIFQAQGIREQMVREIQVGCQQVVGHLVVRRDFAWVRDDNPKWMVLEGVWLSLISRTPLNLVNLEQKRKRIYNVIDETQGTS